MKPEKNILKLGVYMGLLALAALSCSGVADIPNMFATETPTPTITYTPSPTFTPSPTPTETLTPSPTPLPTGVMVEEQADGSTLFIDYDNHYQLTLPKDWIVIPLSSKDIASIINDLSKKNPELKDMAETFQRLDPDVIRVMALHSNPKYVANGYSTNLTLTAIEDALLSAMPLEFVTGAIEGSLEEQGATLLTHGETVKQNSNGVEIGTFEFEKVTPTAQGNKVKVRSRAIVFQTNGKIIMLQLSTLQQFGDELSPVLDDVADSIKRLKQ